MYDVGTQGSDNRKSRKSEKSQSFHWNEQGK